MKLKVHNKMKRRLLSLGGFLLAALGIFLFYEYGMEDGRVIDLETRTTPTLGRELTILEQLLGNLGTIPADVFTTE